MTVDLPYAADVSPFLREPLRLFSAGKPLEAWRAAREGGVEPESLTNVSDLIFAARLAARLGDERGYLRLTRKAWRLAPERRVAVLYRAYRVLETCGPVSTLRFLLPVLEAGKETPDEALADLMTLAARCFGILADHAEADRWMGQALELAPESSWVLTEKACLLSDRDRREEGLELCRGVLERQPFYRPAVAQTASLCAALGRDAEGKELLERAMAATEWADFALMLCNHHSEAEEPEAALKALEEFERRQPLGGERRKRWIAGRRASLLLLTGDIGRAIECAEASGDGFHRELAKRMKKAPPGARRVRLPVGFVRQHSMTCAPATLSALAAYWNRPADHLEVAQKICYDGTPAHSERHWAATSGLNGREFTVTPEIARALQDRGVPFTLVTTWTQNAHLQAVIGYDDRAGLLIIRDPTHRHYAEALLEEFLADYKAHGPRGMLVLPEEERARLDGLELPDAELYDVAHEIDRALERHDRAGAQERYGELCRIAPEHRLRWEALRSLAAYDQDRVKSLEALTKLRELFPDSAVVAWQWYQAAGGEPGREGRLEFLEQQTQKWPGETVFRVERARVLAEDARTAPAALSLLWKHLRRAARDAFACSLAADGLWLLERHDEALAFYRWSACLQEKREDAAGVYFNACVRLNRAEEALGFLRERWRRLGASSAGPGVTLAECLAQLHRDDEVDAVLAESAALRPDDAELAVCAEEVATKRGMFEEAERLLRSVKGRVPEQEWRRRAAALAERRNDPAAAREHWREILKDSPLAMDAHSALARLTADLEGAPAALALLGGACARFPRHNGLAELRVEWLRRERDPRAEECLLEMLEREPANAWAWRELALERHRRLNFEGALEAAAKACEIAPREACSWAIRGMIQQTLGDRAASLECHRRALRLDAGYPGLTHGLLKAVSTAGERLEMVMEIHRELQRQVLQGDEMAQFRAVARAWLSPSELLKILQEAREARPELWQTWAVLIDEHVSRADLASALPLAEGMTKRFPWLPVSWLRLSKVHAVANCQEERLAALERGLKINPGWTVLIREQADALELAGRFEEALEAAERTVRWEPLEEQNYGWWADILLRRGRDEEALPLLERAVNLSPAYRWAWERLTEAARRLRRPDYAWSVAKAAAEKRPGDAAGWGILADMGLRLHRFSDALDAAERGLTLNPRDVNLLDLKAQTLFLMERLEEAEEACRPAVFGDEPPPELRCRVAWMRLRREKADEARSLLESLVETERSFFWPAELLFELHSWAERHNEALKVAELIRERWPESAFGHVAAAQALEKLDRPAEAAAAAVIAFRMDPWHLFSGLTAFDGQLRTGDLAAAGETLEILRRVHPGPRADAARLRLLAARGEEAEVRAELLRLFRSDDPRDAETFRRVSGDEKLADFIRREQEGWPAKEVKNAAAIEGWAGELSAARAFGHAFRLLFSRFPAQTRDHFIEHCLYQVDEKKKRLWLKLLLDLFGWRFRGTTRLWGVALWALLNTRGSTHALTRRRARRWKKHPDAETWMLTNVITVLEANGGARAAAPARRALAEHPDAGNRRDQALAGLAFHEAVSGRPDEARELLANARFSVLEPWGKYLFLLTRSVLAAGESFPSAGDRKLKVIALAEEAEKVCPDAKNTPAGRRACRDADRRLRQYGPELALLPPWWRRLFTDFEPTPWQAGKIVGGVMLLMYLLLIARVIKQEREKETFNPKPAAGRVEPKRTPVAEIPAPSANGPGREKTRPDEDRGGLSSQ